MATITSNVLKKSPHHINKWTGLPCNCHYGRPPRQNRRTASQEIRKLRKQNQKIFRSDEGNQFLDALEELADETPNSESLVAWIASRFKHGDITVQDYGGHPTLYLPNSGSTVRTQLPSWIQWMSARQHPLRRGVNIMELSPDEVSHKSNELRRELAEKSTKKSWFSEWGQTGSPVHTFHPDHAQNEEEDDLLKKFKGWRVHQLMDQHDCRAESDALGHCIGTDPKYANAIEDQEIEAFSLRDPEGYPRMTWHHNPDGTFAHVQGKGTMKQEWRDLISFANNHAGRDDDDGDYGNEHELEGLGGDAEIDLPDPETHDQYIEQYHPDANYYDWAGEYGEVGDHTQINRGDPDWDSIYRSLHEADPQERNNFYHTVLNNGHHQGFDNEVAAWHREDPKYLDPIDHQVKQEWDQAHSRSYDERGRFEAPRMDWTQGRWQTAYDRMQQPLFEDRYAPGVSQYNEFIDTSNPQEGTRTLDPLHPPGGPPNAVTANILDPIHDTLEPRVWDDSGGLEPRLKAHHRRWIQREVFELASKFHPNAQTWCQLVFTGSLTTYQYSDKSDVDISLFVDPHVLPDWSRGQLIGLMVEHMDGKLLPGTPFPLQCFVVAQGISPHDLYQPGLRSGYDLETARWLVPPEHREHDVQREYDVDYVYALESADKMERLLRYDPPRAAMFWHQIHRRRQRDQKSGKGDFSQANIVYKFLANRGLFPGISEASGEYIAKQAAIDWTAPGIGLPHEDQPVHVDFPEGNNSTDFHQSVHQYRTPFALLQHRDDPDEYRVALGHPGSYHPDLPGQHNFNDHWVMAYGSVKPNGYEQMGGRSNSYSEPTIEWYDRYFQPHVDSEIHPDDYTHAEERGLKAGLAEEDRVIPQAEHAVRQALPSLDWQPPRAPVQYGDADLWD